MSEIVHFSANQIAFIEWLAQTKYDRKPATQKLLADDLGINEKTLSRWKKLPEIRQAAIERAREFLGDDLPEIYGALRREAISGSFQHIKLSLELTGEYTDKVKVISWQDELLELLKDGKITIEDITDELGADFAQEFIESSGLHLAGAGPAATESADEAQPGE